MSNSNKKPYNIFAAPEKDDLAGNRQRLLIGSIGLFFPLLLVIITWLRPEVGLPPRSIISSISGYYYSGAVAVFAGMLIAMAIFLFSYRGFDNSGRTLDRIAATVAGAAAVLVATFPTGAPEGFSALNWWSPLVGMIHFAAAATLFLSFAFFSLFLFRKTNAKKGEPVSRAKRTRNSIYTLCGVAMLACIVWVGIAEASGDPIFWPEALALEFFAISWLVKGKAETTVLALGKRTWYYTSNPKRLFTG